MTKETADVAVIGAGIVGMSVAYQLARHDAGRILVLEKATAVGRSSTGASSACLRVRYSHTEVMELACTGLESYGRWQEFTGLSQVQSGQCDGRGRNQVEFTAYPSTSGFAGDS